MQNFWENPSWEEADRHLKALYQAPFQRPFPLLPKGPGLFVIRGPRQVGKSTWLKALLSKTNPKSSYYLSCENIDDHKELTAYLKTISERTVLYLDEISFVDQWWRSIKSLLDKNNQIRIIVTGSHAFDLRLGMDQMPGRWGNGGEFELLPMDFFEFTEMRKQAGWQLKSQLAELEAYLQIGGFPTSVIEAGRNGKKPEKSFEIYRRWLLGDFLKAGKQEIYLKDLMGQIALTMGSTISLQKLAQRTQIASHNTAQDYIQLLESSFALKTLYELDIDTGASRFKKEKKFYFRDPILYWIALDWALLPTPLNALEVLAEMIAHEHLLRKYPKFGFLRNRTGEIDFFLPQKWALEVKWKNLPEGLSKTYKNIQLPTKIVWTKSNFFKEWP